MNRERRSCPHCQRRLCVEFEVDLRGEVVEHVELCGCPESRRLAGICRDCSAPVEGKVGRALRCAYHRAEARKAAIRRYRERHPDRCRASQKRQDERRRTDPEARVKRRQWEREHRSTPEYRARRRLRRRRLAITNPERKRQEHARYIERWGIEHVREQNRRANARRAEAKRQYMHRYATKYAGPGIAPRCEACGAAVPWNGRGRPHKRCRTCDPGSWRRADKRRAKREEQQRREEAA